jgi:hypothetical protein
MASATKEFHLNKFKFKSPMWLQCRTAQVEKSWHFCLKVALALAAHAYKPEIRRIEVQSQPRQIVLETLS